MKRLAVVLCAMWSGAALAGPAKPIKVKAKATVTCNANNKPIKGPIPKDTSSIDCFVTTTQVDAGLGAPYPSLRIWTSTIDTESEPKTTGADSDKKVRRFEMLSSGQDFRTCADMVVHMQLTDGDDAIWQKDLPVTWACPKPKALAAKVTCTQQDQGKAVPMVPAKRLHADLECRVTSKDKRFSDGAASLKVFGDAAWKQGAQHSDGSLGGGGAGAYYDIVFGSDQWEKCADIDFTIIVADENSSPMFKQIFKTKHTCGQ